MQYFKFKHLVKFEFQESIVSKLNNKLPLGNYIVKLITIKMMTLEEEAIHR